MQTAQAYPSCSPLPFSRLIFLRVAVRSASYVMQARSAAVVPQTIGTGDTGEIRSVYEPNERDEREAMHRANMRALLEEAKEGNPDGPRYVVLWFAGTGGTEVARNVHAPIASTQSELVGRWLSTLVGTEEVGACQGGACQVGGRTLKVDVGDECRDERTLEVLVAWMYGADPDDDEDPWTLGDAVKLLRVASYMRMRGLQSRCSKYVEDWADLDGIRPADVPADDVGYLVEVWMVLSTTVTDGPTEPVRVALARTLMHRAVDDPVVVGFLRGCTIENLALLTTGVVCAGRSVDLALAWSQIHDAKYGESGESGESGNAQSGSIEKSVLGHIPLGDLPMSYRERLLASGDERIVRSIERCDRVGRPAKRSKRSERSDRSNPDPKFVWAGVFFGKVGVVDADALDVRRISDTGIRAGLQRGTHQAAVVDERVFLFCTGVGTVFEDTGYVYSTALDSWHPFGTVPGFMAGGHFSTVVYGTWIFFVRMADLAAGPSCVAFDVSMCTWLVMPDILTAREWPCVAVVGDSLYIVGGRRCRDLRVNGGPTTAPTVDAVPTERIRLDMCSTHSAQWERAGPSLARYQSSAVVIGGSIYVTGGYCPDPVRPGTRLVSSALTRIDPGSGTVEEMSSMQWGRCGHSSFVSSDGQIVVLGGAIPQFLSRIRASPAERFDFGKRKWIPFGIPSAESAEY